jgi:hypothetical protein
MDRGLSHQVLHGRAAHPPGRSHRRHDARLHRPRHPLRAVAAGPRHGHRQPGGARARKPTPLRSRPGAAARGDGAPRGQPGAFRARRRRRGPAPRGRGGRPHARSRHGRHLHAVERQELAPALGGLACAQAAAGRLPDASVQPRPPARAPARVARGTRRVVRARGERSAHRQAGFQGFWLLTRCCSLPPWPAASQWAACFSSGGHRAFVSRRSEVR